MSPILVLNRTAESAIGAYRIVTRGTSDSLDAQAVSSSDALLGVNGLGAVVAGRRYDLGVSGLHPVEYGGEVVRGNKLTTDSTGRAVASSSSTDRILGIAWEDGTEGIIGSVLISQS